MVSEDIIFKYYEIKYYWIEIFILKEIYLYQKQPTGIFSSYVEKKSGNI